MNEQLARYIDFLKAKVQLEYATGMEPGEMHPSLFPHQKDIIGWALKRGKALIAAKFGLGKSRMQIEILRQVHQQTGRKVLVICPLGVKHQFIHEDGPAMDTRFQYIGNDEDGMNADTPYLITNYERVRDGQISEGFLQSEIAGVCLDEGAILGNLGTKTQQEFSRILSAIPYRWVATATPAPNDYRQMIYFGDFLDAMDAGQALTRFFGRNPDKAGDLILLDHMERDFWLWVASWCIFVDVPSDLGYSDDGYVMPDLELRFHRIAADHEKAQELTDQFGQHYLLADTAAGVQQAMKEKRNSLQDRIAMVIETVKGILNEPEGTQQSLLRGEQGEGEGAIFGVLPSEQGEDGPREEKGLYEGVPEDVQEAEENAGRAGGDQSKEAGTLRERSGISGACQGEGARESVTQAAHQTSLPSEVGVRTDAERVQRDSEKAGGGCAICGTEQTNVTTRKEKIEKRLYIDHDHETGEVRGILCHHCNFGLGQFKDDPELLAKAINYLKNNWSSGVI